MTALVARLEAFEAENKHLQHCVQSKRTALRIETIAHDDTLIKYYTGFHSYEQLVHFYGQKSTTIGTGDQNVLLVLGREHEKQSLTH